MSSNPYENEPGFETANGEDDKKNQKEYVAKVSENLHCNICIKHLSGPLILRF